MSRSRQRWMLVAMVTVLSLTPSLWAANILWAPAGGGSWGDTTKWTGGILPLDTDAVTFQTNIAAGDATVTLDGNRTVTANPTYAITFQYAQTTKWWIIASGTGGNGSANTLTLANSTTASSPYVQVANSHAVEISAIVAGNQGLTILGSGGTLFLSNTNNTFSAQPKSSNQSSSQVRVHSGRLIIAGDGSLGAAGSVVGLNSGNFLAPGGIDFVSGTSATAGSLGTPDNSGLIEVNREVRLNAVSSWGVFTPGVNSTLRINGLITNNGANVMLVSSNTGGTVDVAGGVNLAYIGDGTGRALQLDGPGNFILSSDIGRLETCDSNTAPYPGYTAWYASDPTKRTAANTPIAAGQKPLIQQIVSATTAERLIVQPTFTGTLTIKAPLSYRGTTSLQAGTTLVETDALAGQIALLNLTSTNGNNVLTASGNVSLPLGTNIVGNFTSETQTVVTQVSYDSGTDKTSIYLNKNALTTRNLVGTATVNRAGAFGDGTSANAVLLGNGSGSSNAALLLNGPYTVFKTIQVLNGNTGLITLGQNAAAAGTFSGNVTLGSGTDLAKDATLAARTAGEADFTGNLLANGASTANVTIGKAGFDGIVKLAGTNNNYTGVTNIAYGTLLVTGTIANSSQVNVAAGSTLGGTGFIASPVTLTGATLNPGTPASPGILTTGTLSLDPASSFLARLNGTSAFAQVAANGDVNLGSSALSLNLAYAPAVGDTYTLVDNHGPSAITGTFASLTQGQLLNKSYSGTRYWLQMSYTGGTGNDAVLQAVATPLAVLSGLKFNDANHNGSQDTGELGLEGWTINLFTSSGTVTAVTDTLGAYSFSLANLAAPTAYTLTETGSTGWTQTAPVGGSWTGTIDAGQTIAGCDFGNYVAVTDIPGDINRDHIVDQADYTVWYNHYGQTPATWSDGDVTGDNIVDQADYTVWYNHYGQTGGNVPEPMTMALLAIGGLAMLRRRN